MNSIIEYLNTCTFLEKPKHLKETLLSLSDSLNIDLYDNVTIEYIHNNLDECSTIVFIDFILFDLPQQQKLDLALEQYKKTLAKKSIDYHYKNMCDGCNRSALAFISGIYTLSNTYKTYFPKLIDFMKKWEDSEYEDEIKTMVDEGNTDFEDDFYSAINNEEIIKFKDDYFDYSEEYNLYYSPTSSKFVIVEGFNISVAKSTAYSLAI